MLVDGREIAEDLVIPTTFEQDSTAKHLNKRRDNMLIRETMTQCKNKTKIHELVFCNPEHCHQLS